MRKILVAIIFTFATTTIYAQASTSAAPAQGQQAPKTLEQRADEMTAGMTKNLRLTAEQSKKVRDINLTSMQHAETARANYKTDPKKFAQIMDIISQTRLQQIKEVLTQQQFTQYQSRREEKMGVPKEAQSNPANRQQESMYQNQY